MKQTIEAVDHQKHKKREAIIAENTAQIAKWDAGEGLWSIEMGGLGPGYEQAIQVLIVEMVRDNVSMELADEPTEEDTKIKANGLLTDRQQKWEAFNANFTKATDKTVHRIDDKCGGFSGAQVGAAKNCAYRILRDGWDAAAKSAPEDRRIQISNYWPKAESW